ncbi:HNH endonuclease [Tenacibaculum finnmarkense]|uniref:HNH endonuclease n=1 Tax=Tenacibaculum finnmarkense TaxID=2781243 RepID=UPI001E34C096|nr:HNH endonuclease signature motif containing protein [Tenacibaculum finnmarkense]MCD8401334.1 HNH endonuclease [Tenacibaculum finnmarkense genomovar ulcerans]MCG8786465.1 HNH endonuclease [Tenacibaculum finnmarkense]MCG8796623.1 HNH endonuclease [Tenacibaculum finnmarkense]MCG8798953.1 HNH endonuclease [Tenacibaculum finnmarkense]MCG8808928.1 HNH endonuclease [Tenacibaculum finnmarkense]
MSNKNKELRDEIFKKYDGKCAYCGDDLKKMQVDHIIPQRNFLESIVNQNDIPCFLKHLKEEDVNHIDNLNPSCATCNKFKDTFSLSNFRRELGNQLSRAKKYSSNFRFALKYNQVKETPAEIIFHFEKVGV